MSIDDIIDTLIEILDSERLSEVTTGQIIEIIKSLKEIRA